MDHGQVVGCSLLSSEQQEELRRLLMYYPYRVVFGVLYKDTGEFEAWAKHTRHAANRLARDGHHVVVMS